MIQQPQTTPDIRSRSLATGTLRVDMIGDLVCPWSFLGKRRLDRALDAVHGPTAFRWLPFQVNPDMPAEGMQFEAYLASKFGDPAKVQPGLDELTSAGRQEGIRFRFDLLERVPNTLAAQTLIQFAEIEGFNTSAVADGLFSSYFEEGLDIADRDVLAEIGGSHGLGRNGVLRALDDETCRNRVLERESDIRRGGVSGVPDFLINDRLIVIGSQPTDVLVDAFDRAMFGEDSETPVASGILH